MATPVDGGPMGLGPYVQLREAKPPYLYHHGEFMTAAFAMAGQDPFRPADWP